MRTFLRWIKSVASIACVLGLVLGSTLSLLPRSASAQSTSSTDEQLPLFEAGRVLVKFKADVPETEQETLLAQHNLEKLRELASLRVGLLQTRAGTELAVVEALNASPLVEYAEPDYIYHAFQTTGASVTPSDPSFGDQWGLAKINALAAWDFTTGSPDVTIAILDSGADAAHPDLTPKFTTGHNAFFQLGATQDRDGHGTHVAGIAGAASNNGIGTAGVAWGARIMPVKVLTRFGGSTSVIAEGIQWATDNGANIINMSLGGTQDAQVLREAVQYAANRNVLLLAAMGNEFQVGNFINYPAAYPEVMAVAATDRNDAHANFSNSGAHVEVAAPGVDILSTYRVGGVSTYTELSGTSMATPHVSGLAALLFSINPNLSAADVRALIILSATDVGAPGWDPETGYGRIDALTALVFALSGVTAADLPANSGNEAPDTPAADPAADPAANLDKNVFLPVAAY